MVSVTLRPSYRLLSMNLHELNLPRCSGRCNGLCLILLRLLGPELISWLLRCLCMSSPWYAQYHSACRPKALQATPLQRKSTVAPMATCPVPVPPVRSSIVSVSVRSVVVTGRIIGRAVKRWHWKRNRESDENSSLGLRLEQHRHAKNKRKDQKQSSHISKLPDEPAARSVTVVETGFSEFTCHLQQPEPADTCYLQRPDPR